MDIDRTKSRAMETLTFDESEHFGMLRHWRHRQRVKEIQSIFATWQIPAGELLDHKGMNYHCPLI